MESLFKLQQTVVKGSNTLSLLGAMSSIIDLSGNFVDDMELKFTGNSEEFGKNATDISVLDLSIFGSSSSALGLNEEIGDFKI